MLAPTSLQLSAILILIGTDADNLIPDQLENPQCGTVHKQANSIQPRIVGGYEASSGAWPWQIAVLDYRKRFICGGTLISSEFVLTAAHCVKDKQQMHIIAGEFNLVDNEGYEQARRVSRAFKHPQYSKENHYNDIALLKLASPVELTQRVWPACLPEQDEELHPELMATILGWGAISFRKEGAKTTIQRDDMLRQAVVPVVDYEECKNSYGDYYVGPNTICAGFKKGEVDSCAGDSGGPLLFERNNRWHVYGITSFGDECGKEDKYGIYSKTSAFVSWIKKTVAKHTSSRISV